MIVHATYPASGAYVLSLVSVSAPRAAGTNRNRNSVRVMRLLRHYPGANLDLRHLQATAVATCVYDARSALDLKRALEYCRSFLG